MARMYAPPSQDFLQKTLSAELLEGVTASASLNNVTGIQNLPGIMIIDRVDANGTATPSKTEVIAFTATSGSTVTTLTRGLAGTTDQDHAVSAVVEFSPDVVWAQSMYDALTAVVVASTGALDTTKVVDLTTAQTLTNKTLTSPVINTGISGTAIVDEDDMTSNSATKVPTQQSVKAYVDAEVAGVDVAADGWIASADTWTYASASTFTIAGVDRTAVYTKGTRLKFTQTTAKYAVVVNSSFSTDTTVTIAVNTDYTIANAAITSPYYSYAANPQGYPGWFNWTPTFTGFSADPTNTFHRFSVVGKQCFINIRHNTDGTSNATGFSLTLPITSANVGANMFWEGALFTRDNSANAGVGHGYIGNNSATLTIEKLITSTTFTASGGKAVHGQTFYEI